MLYTTSIIIKLESVQIISVSFQSAVTGGRIRKGVIVTLIEGEGIISKWA